MSAKMKFKEAAALARLTPGSTVRGNPDDGYVVSVPDSGGGRPPPAPDSQSPRNPDSSQKDIEWRQKLATEIAKHAAAIAELTRKHQSELAQAKARERKLVIEASEHEANIAELIRKHQSEVAQSKKRERKFEAEISVHEATIAELTRKHQSELAQLPHDKDELMRKIVKTCKDEVRKFQEKLNMLQDDFRVAEGTIERLQAENRMLTSQLKKSPSTPRISKQPKPTARGSRLLAERRVVKCSCHGEVENCFKCSGRGTYTVDGNRNPV